MIEWIARKRKNVVVVYVVFGKRKDSANERNACFVEETEIQEMKLSVHH